MSTRPPSSVLPSLPLKLRSHPSVPQTFPHFALVRSVIPPNVTPAGPEALPAVQAAVVPLGYGKSKFLPEHKAEIEGKGKELGQRSSSTTRKGTKGTRLGAETCESFSLRSPFRSPAQYLARQNRPGLFRVLGERELAYFSQSSKANLSTSATKRAESPIPLNTVISLYQGIRKLSASPARKTPSPLKKRERKADDEGIKSYEGEQHNSVKQGKGTSVYFNGDVYKGFWAGNKRNGQGVLTSQVWGTTFAGEWREDRRHGTGVLTCANGDIVKGVWRDDALDMTNVTIRFLSFEVLYTGSLRDCQFHGFGQADFIRDQVRYSGSWECGQRHGWGHISFPNSHYFEGLFESGYTKGPGLLVYRKALVLREEGKGETLRKMVRRKGGLQASESHASLSNKTEGLGNCASFSTFLAEIELYDTDILWKTMTTAELKAAGCNFEATDGCFTAGKLTG